LGLLLKIANTESILELEAAMRDRLEDAFTLAVEGKSFAACYLFGYVAEIALKTTYFRFQQKPVTIDIAADIKSMHKKLQAVQPSANLHNVEAWAEQIIAARAAVNRALDAPLDSSLRTRASAVADHWAETIRYRRSVPANDEALELFEQATWFLDNHASFWR